MQSIDPTDEKRVESWVKDPGRFDIVGIDAPPGAKVTLEKKKPRIKDVEPTVIGGGKSRKKKEKALAARGSGRGSGSRGKDLGLGIVQDSRGRHLKLD